MSSNKLDLPKSTNTVRVRMLDTTSVMTLKSQSFIKPVVPGHEVMNVNDVAFLIENERLGKKAMFDLGVRKDYWNMPPTIQKRLGALIPGLRVDKDTTELLEESGVPLNEIDDVIWSHTHWDHTGSTYLFPYSTNLVYGPGVSSKLPAFPKNPSSPLVGADFEGRKNIELETDSQVGPFAARDFYGDGSLYLLHTPGHQPNHICALARTTPDTFVFLGGDICHFAGDFRPSETIPLPETVELAPRGSKSQWASVYRSPVSCPCALFTSHHPRADPEASELTKRTTAWYQVSDHPTTAYDEPETAVETVRKMQLFDDDANVLVCLAHDPALLRHLPTLNDQPDRDINDWKQQGWKEKCHWTWLAELPHHDAEDEDEDAEGEGEGAGEGKRKGEMGGTGQVRPGRKHPIVEGYWRDGKPWDMADEEMKEKGEKEQKRAEDGKM